MSQTTEISLQLQSIDQLVEPCAPSPFLKRRLREDAEDFIVEQAMALSRTGNVTLVVHLQEHDATDELEIAEAVRRHFAFRREKANQDLRRLRRFGFKALLIAFVFLGTAMLVVQLLGRYASAVPFSSVVAEGLTILAWVAFWRPGELLLYEWYPFERDARVFGRLERANVRMVRAAFDAREAATSGRFG